MRHIAIFGTVGLLASLSHFLVAAAAMSFAAVPIFLANLIGFAVAFGVSYLGHYHFTFASDAAHRQALPRFLATAITGLAVNNLVLAALIWATGQRSVLFIAVAILVAAGIVYLLARRWAFR